MKRLQFTYRGAEWVTYCDWFSLFHGVLVTHHPVSGVKCFNPEGEVSCQPA